MHEHGRPILQALLASVGLVLFALFSHRGFPLVVVGACGILAAAFAIQWSFDSTRGLLRAIGLSARPRRPALSIAIACGVGIGLGLLFRDFLGLSILPSRLEAFVLLSCLIGAAEELVYRGWIQARLRLTVAGSRLGFIPAVIGAAVAHTAYKLALFAWPSVSARIDYPFLLLWTMAAGAVFGLARELSDSVVPPMIGHAAFDLLVYGAVAQAPWWVWT
jgi:membrane protease YdiL (CAAX protease family)